MRRIVTAFAIVAASAPMSSPAFGEGGGFAWCGESSCVADAHRTTDAEGPERPNAGPNPVSECFLRPVDDLTLGTEVYDKDGKLVGIADGTGSWYHRDCTPGAEGLFLGDELVFIRQPSPEALRDHARRELIIPALTTRTSPASTTYVNARTWLWVEGADWRPQSATASVPGITVTVTATPVTVTWDMGDGSLPFECGPGKPYTPDEEPPCVYAYAKSSAGQPDEAYRATATVHWTISWTVAGAPGGGGLGMAETRSSMAVRVAEIQTERAS